jgi:hypothetical protein
MLVCFKYYGCSLTRLLIETEGLPIELGWVRPAVPIGNLDLCQMTQRVLNASGTTLKSVQEILPCSDFNA